jgi:hypothetical protein
MRNPVRFGNGVRFDILNYVAKVGHANFLRILVYAIPSPLLLNL